MPSPYLLYSDANGKIFEDRTLYVTGRTGWDAVAIPTEDWIELPNGGTLYELPGRKGIGIDVESGEMRLCEKGWAVAAFIPPAAFISLLTKPNPAHPRFRFFATPQWVGRMINFLVRPRASNLTSDKTAAATTKIKSIWAQADY